MFAQQHVPVLSTEHVRSHLAQHLQGLINRRPGTTVGDDDLQDAMAMLNALPLGTAEFGVASSRLKNARRYLTASEPGAARWELRMLLGSLREPDERRPIGPRLRKRQPA